MFEYRAEVLKVVDGDTVDFRIDLGFRIQQTIRTRLKGIDTPEMGTEAGRAAKAAVMSLLPVGSKVVIQTAVNPGDKYGRWLAHVLLPGRGNLNDWLVAAGHAVRYDGGAKP